MFNPKKLADYLERLVPDYGSALAKTALSLEEKMDHFDLEKQSGKVYVDMGTGDATIWGIQHANHFQPTMIVNNSNVPFWVTYPPSPVQTMYMSNIGTWPVDTTPAPPDLRYEDLKGLISKLSLATPISPPKPSPDYIHTLTGWRGWEVRCDKLQALGTEFAWPFKQAPAAYCHHGDHAAPEAKCQCGYWSFKSIDLLTQAIKPYAGEVMVIGSVEIWGKVVECENGWRSEFAYPKELWLLREGLESLSWTYGVPVRTLGAGDGQAQQ